MKKIFLCLILISLPAILPAWTGNWDEIKKGTTGIKSVSSDFIQRKYIKMLARPVYAEGSFKFQIPDSLRWEYKSPDKSIIINSGGVIRRYGFSDGKFREDKGGSIQAMQFVFQEIAKWLKGDFNSGKDFVPELVPGVKIIFKPRSSSLSQYIKSIELVFADRPGIIKQVIIIESEKSRTVMEFVNPVINVPIDPKFFSEM
jgi:outer membrane lipoprotein carrier protein